MAGGNAIFRCQAISKPFLVTYPDGSKRHIDRETRDALLASLSIREVAFRRYKYVSRPVIMHTFADLGRFAFAAEGTVRRFIAGNFVFVYRGKKLFEPALETEHGMTIRLLKDGAIA